MKNLKEIVKKWVPAKWYARFKFPETSAFIHGRLPENNNPRRSIIFYTTRKCASTYMQFVFRFLNKHYLHLTPLELENYLYLVETDSTQQIDGKLSTRIPEKGVFWYPVRNYYDTGKNDQYDIIVMTRDPRDVLVSNYFTVAENHPLPISGPRREDLLKRREEIKKMALDEYVLTREKEMRIYKNFSEQLLGKPNVTLLRYEDMMLDFDTWLNALETSLKITISDEHKRELKSKSAVDVTSAQKKNKHIRQAMPNDFERKLKPETVQALNEKYAGLLKALGYLK